MVEILNQSAYSAAITANSTHAVDHLMGFSFYATVSTGVVSFHDGTSTSADAIFRVAVAVGEPYTYESLVKRQTDNGVYVDVVGATITGVLLI